MPCSPTARLRHGLCQLPDDTNFGGQAGGIVGMSAAKQYNTYAVGDVTVGNGGTKHTWVGALAGEITSSGMSKDSSGSYTVYPEQGAFRIGNYFAGDAVLKVETYDGDTLKETKTVEPTVDRGFSSTLKSVDMAMTSVAMTKADMAAAAFAGTLSGNIPEINAVLAAYGITGVALREWQLDGGRVLPTGDVWVSGEVDTGIFASGDGTQASPYLIRTAEQLRAFAGSLNNKINYADKYVALDADIDVSDAAWTPIGGSDWAFAGTFDGRGHTISGLTVGSASAPLALDGDNLFIACSACWRKRPSCAMSRSGTLRSTPVMRPRPMSAALRATSMAAASPTSSPAPLWTAARSPAPSPTRPRRATSLSAASWACSIRARSSTALPLRICPARS